MASSRVTSPPVSLKDRIAALEKKKNPNGAQSTSPPPTSPPARSLSPTGNAVPANNVNNLRDKITKFEKKGGTPIPRGSFGLGAPPPDIPGAPKRKGELYGNRVPGLDRPTHAPVVTRSITAPLRPQMTGGDVIGLRPQMTGADPSYLRPQFTGDAVMRRAVSSYEPGGSSHSGDGEMQSYAPFVPPTSPPSDSNELLPNVQDLSEAVGVSSDPTSSTRSADTASTTSQGVSSLPDGPQTTAFEETDTSAEAASHQQGVPTVQLTQAPEALQPTSSAPEAKAELKSQGSAETLREAIASPDRKAVKSSLTTDNTPSARVASTSERDSLELDNVGDRSTASIDLQDVSIITITQPQVYLTSSVPRSVVVEPSPPSSRPQSRTERSPKPAQRSTTQYEAPKPTSYVEPEFDVPKSPPPSKSTFTAVVHRRTTVQNNERPATTFETAAGSSDAPEVEPAATLSPAPRVPVQTVTDSEVSFSAEDLGSLLADAALLEEALNLGPVSTPKKDVFPHVSLASTLSAVPQDVYNQGKHSRTGSQMTIKALEREDSPSVAEPKASSSASVGKASAPAKAVAPSPPNVIVAKPEPVTISDFSDFGFQELIAPSEIGRFSAPEIGDEIPPTPPPKSPPSSYLSSMRSSAAKRMSSLLPEGPRHSVSSSEDSAPVTTPPSNDLDVQVTRSPRHSKSYNALRDDTSQKSRSTGGGDDLSFVSHESKRSKWSFKSSSKSSKGLSRASTFADRIWPGSSKRKTSNNNVEEPPEVPPLAQSASLGSKPKSTQRLAADSPPQLPPSPSVLESGSSRPVSWLSEASSALSSPGFDDQFFDQFPSVPPESGSSTQQSLGTPPSNNSKVGLDGTLLTPPDRGSSLSHMFSSSRQR